MTLQSLFQYVNQQESHWISKLSDAVAIESVSGEAGRRPECLRMAEWTINEMKTLGIQ